MNVDDIRSLYDYTIWANARFFGAAGELSTEQLVRDLKSSFPSIRDTLSHIVSGEWVWLRRWLGESPSALPEWLENPSLESLRADLAKVEKERASFFSSLSPKDLERRVRYRNFKGDAMDFLLGDVLVHVANHSTYHRGQLATMFRQVGAAPPATDLTVYKVETAAEGR
jgi:uncharacterized damage-inducible protein DinB